jgi:EAL domain-containing protein (putative c-di-GMP-specific phosphodiesterase class I)
MTDIERCKETMSALSKLGVKIAIDDFGTGYSSLPYLNHLPIDTLKIDKSFVFDMTLNENNGVIVRSIIDLGHNLGIQIVAEGVEHKDSIEALKTLGCDSAQGYHISRPMPVSAFTSWMNTSTGYTSH